MPKRRRDFVGIVISELGCDPGLIGTQLGLAEYRVLVQAQSIFQFVTERKLEAEFFLGLLVDPGQLRADKYSLKLPGEGGVPLTKLSNN